MAMVAGKVTVMVVAREAAQVVGSEAEPVMAVLMVALAGI